MLAECSQFRVSSSAQQGISAVVNTLEINWRECLDISESNVVVSVSQVDLVSGIWSSADPTNKYFTGFKCEA